MGGAIHTVSQLAIRDPTAESLQALCRVDALRRGFEAGKADWPTELAWGAHRGAVQLFKAGKYERAAGFAQVACDIEGALNQYDLLAVTCWKSGDQKVRLCVGEADRQRATRALISGLQNLPPHLLQTIEQGAAKDPLDVVFADPSFANVSMCAQRLANYALADETLKDDLDFINSPAMAALAEHVLATWTELPKELVLAMGQAMLKVYEHMPIRRLRVATRMIELGQEVETRIKAPYGADAALAAFVPEHNGQLAIARAFATYHAEQGSSDMPQRVLKFANDAITKSRPLIGKRRDDQKRLFASLDRLCSLLGMLGHSLAKIDGLRLLRQLQRKDIGAYAVTSARLGSEYSKLGKSSRAAVVFAQISSPSVETQLRYAAFLATIGNLDKR